MRFPDGMASVRGLPVVRACGRPAFRQDDAAEQIRLVDATAGLGYDAYLLAIAGFHVTAIERSLEVFRLLADGLHRHPVERLAILHGQAATLLPTLAPDVVYLDPMYPPKNRSSALPSKDMQIVRALVGDDTDSAALFAVAREVARRVVVKRPAHAAPLGEPSMQITGKLARFDVYIGEARSKK